jgi:MFS family permease
MRNRNLWLVSLLFCCYNFVFVSFLTWGPTFLQSVRHASIIRASHIIGVASIVNMLASPLAGFLLDKTGARKVMSALPLLVMAFLFPVSTMVSDNVFLALAAAVGFFGGSIPAGVFSSAADIVGDERLAGIAMAVIQIGQNAGMMLGPLIFGFVIESWGWQVAFRALAPVGIFGTVCGLLANFSRQPPLVSCES